jgi:hypothetical protein
VTSVAGFRSWEYLRERRAAPRRVFFGGAGAVSPKRTPVARARPFEYFAKRYPKMFKLNRPTDFRSLVFSDSVIGTEHSVTIAAVFSCGFHALLNCVNPTDPTEEMANEEKIYPTIDCNVPRVLSEYFKRIFDERASERPIDEHSCQKVPPRKLRI